MSSRDKTNVSTVSTLGLWNEILERMGTFDRNNNLANLEPELHSAILEMTVKGDRVFAMLDRRSAPKCEINRDNEQRKCPDCGNWKRINCYKCGRCAVHLIKLSLIHI